MQNSRNQSIIIVVFLVALCIGALVLWKTNNKAGSGNTANTKQNSAMNEPLPNGALTFTCLEGGSFALASQGNDSVVLIPREGTFTKTTMARKAIDGQVYFEGGTNSITLNTEGMLLLTTADTIYHCNTTGGSAADLFK